LHDVIGMSVYFFIYLIFFQNLLLKTGKMQYSRTSISADSIFTVSAICGLSCPGSGFGGLVVSMLVSSTQVHGFKLCGSRPQHAFLWKGSKAVCPMS
jgi:hypothetical protein